MRYAIVIEKGKKNYGVYVPDVPGCVSVGDSVEECLLNIREALQIHFAGMREDGDRIPDPVSLVEYVDVPVVDAISQPVASRESNGRIPRPAESSLSKPTRRVRVGAAKA